MRSILFTLLLAIIAFLLCGLTGWRLTQGSLNALFGAPPTAEGERLYENFQSQDVHRVSLAANGTRAVFQRDASGLWKMEYPWKDRMDPRFAETIIAFTLGTRVADVIPKEKLDSRQENFRDGQVGVLFENAEGRTLCKYILGRKTSWVGTDPTTQEEVPTVFIRPLDKSRKNYVYACNGDIHPLFKDGFRFLRDHQPFLFRPNQLQRIRIRNAGGELTLGRESADEPWRIIKPLDLPTDYVALKRLLEGLINLRAIKVSNREDVTLPTNTNNANEQIAIQFFGAATETVLDILPSQTTDSATRLAVISDRPNAVFELPFKANSDLVSLSELPLGVNDLRDSKLTNLSIAAIKSISIEPTGRPALRITKHPGKWTLGDAPESPAANERRLYDLLKVATETKIQAFVTDAATDFTPWGLDKPFLRLRFMAADDQALELAFGNDKSGGTYVHRPGSTSVMKLDPEVITRIATQAYQWRDSRLWNVNATDLRALMIRQTSKPPLELDYDSFNDSWKAQSDGKDLSAEIDQTRANYLLGVLSSLSVNRWLPIGNPEAENALQTPSLRFTLRSQVVDEEGNEQGEQSQTLSIAPASNSPNNRFYYGILDTDDHPFVLDQEMLDKLNVELMSP